MLDSNNYYGSSPSGAVPLDGAGRLRPAAGSGTKAPIPTQFDVFMLAGMVLSAVVVIAAFLGKHLLFDGHGDAGGFLLIGLVIIGLSGAGAWWIRQILREQPL